MTVETMLTRRGVVAFLQSAGRGPRDHGATCTSAGGGGRSSGEEAAAVDIKEINRATITRFRAGEELDGGMHRDRLVLLTTVGRRSGESRTSPMMFHRDGDRIVVIASNMGAAQHPAWYLNLVAEPRVTVELDTESYDGMATPLAGAQRDRVWAELKLRYPFFAEHEAATTRTIPVVAITRAG
jgi:deazaflavin-dependent oxidoreductase (nitroreductase family)